MCAGYGGIGLGIKNIFGERLRTIAYCELEGFAQANLISKMEKGLLDAAPIWSDLKTFPYESFHRLVDILIAGYPCQPFSAAGKRAGKEDPRHLWPWIADGIRLLQPRMCFFENVEGHISLGLSIVISDLEELGYKSSFGIFSASEVGAVHQRKRVFIMAHRNGEGFCREKWFWQAGAQGASSGYSTECGSSMADTNSRRMSGSRNELGNAGEAGQGWSNTSQDGIIGNVWPSRPGQPQYAWEPPRVVANSKHDGLTSCQIGGSTCETIPEKQIWEDNSLNIERASCIATTKSDGMGNSSQLFCYGSNNNRGISEQGEQIPESRNSSWEAAMGNAKSRENNGRESRDMAEASSQRGCCDDATNGASESETMGNATNRRRGKSGDETCEGAGNWTSRTSGSNDELSKTQQPMGYSTHGAESRLGISELSGLSDSELAEIREWMVRCDNRTDELRLLGNGVVPATATRAFLTLLEKLK
jgi:site-specific DNA-cytosine methylase